MTVVKDSPAPTMNTPSPSETPVLAHPWEDFATVMRHAHRARAAGDLQRALTFYTRALDLNPNSAEAWTGRASSTSNLDEAIVAWGYALALEPSDQARTMLSACVSEIINQSDAADAESLVSLGRRLAETGQWSYAHRLFKRATKLDASNEEAWLWRAGVASDATETIDCLNRVLELNPQNAQAEAGLKWAAAKQQAATVSPDASKQAAVVLDEGQRALREGDRAGAHDRFVRATELDPRNAMAWFWRGSSASDIDEALSCMEQVLAIDPADEAAKDARWWLRVQKLRERSPALTNTTPHPPTITMPAAAGVATSVSSREAGHANKRGGVVLLIAVALLACLIVALIVVVLAIHLV
jgi:tetratricopeptide (TPR) repeat protein